jgi:purine-binding chemotaxis protein CheW
MTTASVASAAQAGKYLTFDLAEEHYGLEIMRVQEIVGIMPVTRVPRMPEFVAGVVNLRGRVIPVVDLRLAFGLPGVETTDRTCIIVVRIERESGASVVMGVIVDEVSDVAYLADDAIEETPEFTSDVDTSFIKGVGRIEQRVLLLLDIDRVWSGSEMEIVGRAVVPATTDAGVAERESGV